MCHSHAQINHHKQSKHHTNYIQGRDLINASTIAKATALGTGTDTLLFHPPLLFLLPPGRASTIYWNRMWQVRKIYWTPPGLNQTVARPGLQYVCLYIYHYIKQISQQSTLTAKLESLGNSCLQAPSSMGNRFYRQEAPCSESIQIPFRTQSEFLHSSFRIHSGSIQNSFKTHSEFIPNYNRMCPYEDSNTYKLNFEIVMFPKPILACIYILYIYIYIYIHIHITSFCLWDLPFGESIFRIRTFLKSS